MEIKNKGNKYINIIVIICLLLGCTFGFLVGVNISNVKAKLVTVVDAEKEYIQTKLIEVPVITQSVNINTEIKEENKNKEDKFKININTASLKELDSLPGIGEGLANNIITYREENGVFTNITQLMNVPKIGTSTFEKIKNEVVID